MKKIIYVCDLCKKEYDDNKQVFGIFWDDDGDLSVCNGEVGDRHICNDCINGIKTCI